MHQALAYYKRHSYLTNPGDHGSIFDCLPEDMGALHEAIGGVLIHRWKMKNHPDILQGRENEVFIRHIHCLLDALLALDNRPLTTIRPIDKRMIINCRHFATLLCSILRHRGIPARVRNGFAT